jgi:AraC family transcriptional regulator
MLARYLYFPATRVERTKQLLLQGKMSLSEIAIACGFSHQSHLNRHFKRLTGVTPKTWIE